MVMKLKVYECYMLYDEHVYQGYGCGEPSWTARVSRLLLLIIALSTLLQAVKQIGSFSLSHLIVLLNLYLLLQKEKLLQDFSGTKVFKYHKDQV
jgi:predicted Na+-dependent transporter